MRAANDLLELRQFLDKNLQRRVKIIPRPKFTPLLHLVDNMRNDSQKSSDGKTRQREKSIFDAKMDDVENEVELEAVVKGGKKV